MHRVEYEPWESVVCHDPKTIVIQFMFRFVFAFAVLLFSYAFLVMFYNYLQQLGNDLSEPSDDGYLIVS